MTECEKKQLKHKKQSYRYVDEGRVTHEVVEGLRAGDSKAFEVVYLTYKNLISSFLEKLTGSRENAHDITQEIFIQLWENRSAIDPDKSMVAFLFRIARNKAYNLLRESYKFQQLPEDYEQILGVTVHAADEEMIAKETQLLVEIAVANMPEQRQAVYKLSEQGLSYEEIAVKLGITQENARKHLSLARKDLEILRSLILLFLLS